VEFNDILRGAGIDPAEVGLILHKPGDPHLRRMVCHIAADRPDLFAAYQGTHAAVQEATLKARRIAASFVMAESGQLTFVGLYQQTGWQDLSAEALDVRPDMQALQRLTGEWRFRQQATENGRQAWALFRLPPMPALAELGGRLVVADPGQRNYLRRAETTPLPVLEIRRNPSLSPEMPAWDRLVLGAEDLADLPRSWAIRLADWRGVYLLLDRRDGQRYVGSAYGAENLLGRWRAHVAHDTGVTAELGRRPTDLFLFSILELLTHTAAPEQVLAAEESWKLRLHTRPFGLNRN